jgi:hypothetical protein
MPVQYGSIILKVMGGLGIVALSFWITLNLIDRSDRLTVIQAGQAARSPTAAQSAPAQTRSFPYDFPFDDSFFITDANWSHGIARNSAGFFVPNTPKYYNEYKVRKFVQFANGETREITQVNPNSQYLNIVVSGGPLTFEKVGLPTKFVVVDKADHAPK